MREKLLGDGLSESREVVSIARLEESGEKILHYRFFNALRTDVGGSKAVPILLTPEIYQRSIPFVELAQWLGPARASGERLMDVAGGIFGFHLRSQVEIQKVNEDQVRFKVVGGHFQGLAGSMEIQNLDHVSRWKKIMTLEGELSEPVSGPLHSTPKFILERGAEAVFSFTGKRMRTHFEEH